MPCIRCGIEGPLAESHILPAAFYRQVQQDSSILLQFGSGDDAHRRKLRKGSYVTDILCPECDNWLNQRYEQYAIEVLIEERGITPVYLIREDLQLWRLDAVDIQRLKLFLLSILWRADRSDHATYRGFHLGPAAAQIQAMVLNEDPCRQDEFPVIATRWDLRPGLLLPHDYAIDGVPFWEVNLGDWHFLVKSDGQPTPAFLALLELTPGAAGLVLPREFIGSGHYELMRSMVLQSNERRGNAKVKADQ